MSDSFTIDVDAFALFDAITALGPIAQSHVNEASAVTAAAIVAEAKARLARQLGPNSTGRTLAGITSEAASDGNGSLVVSENPAMPNLPLWIEKGTKKGKPGSHRSDPRPYFYASVLLEQGNALRRWEQALDDAIAEQGLGS